MTVTSHDFGGAAQLSATATLEDGRSFHADVVDRISGMDVAAPAGNCGSVFSQQQFASVPVDQDCDGIADSWEDANSTQNGSHLPPNWDREPTYGANVGDGYSVHDEYRGFHYILDSRTGGDQVRWASTDPLNKIDVFFCDPSDKITPALRNILAMQGTASEIASYDPSDPNALTHFKFVYRRVNPDQANFMPGTLRSLSLNRKSVFFPQQSAYAVVYLDGPVVANLPPGQSALGYTGSPTNDGLAIKIDTAAIGAGAARGWPSLSYDVLLAEVVAHETGHHFGQYHPLRPNCCLGVLVGAGQLATLTPQQIGFLNNVPSQEFYINFDVRLKRYTVTSATLQATALGDDIQFAIGNPGPVRNAPPSLVVDDPVNNLPVYSISLNDSISVSGSAGPIPEVYVKEQRLHLMDWSPNLSLQTFGNWQFNHGSAPNLQVRVRTGLMNQPTGNLEDLCVTRVCTQ